MASCPASCSASIATSRLPAVVDRGARARRDQRRRVGLQDDRRAPPPAPRAAAARARRTAVGAARRAVHAEDAPASSTTRGVQRRAAAAPAACGILRHRADAGDAHVDDLDRVSREGVPVLGRWRSWKAVQTPRAPASSSSPPAAAPAARSPGRRSGSRPQRSTRTSSGATPSAASCSRDARAPARRGPRRAARGRSRPRPGTRVASAVVLDVGGQQADRRGDAGVGRHDHLAHAEHARRPRRACSGPAPPNATSVIARGSMPFWTVSARMALAMWRR